MLDRCSCSDDARGCFAVLSSAGRELLDRAQPTLLDGVRERFLAHLEPTTSTRLAELFERMLPAPRLDKTPLRFSILCTGHNAARNPLHTLNKEALA